MGIISGMDSYLTHRKEQQRADFSQFVGLSDGEICVLRFLTPYDEIRTGWFHSLQDISSGGKKFSREIYCSRKETGFCEFCDADEEVAKTKPRHFLYAWVYYYLRKSQNPDRNNDPESALWPQVTRGAEIYFKEEINSIKVLRVGPGQGGYISKKFASYNAKFGNINDRDYEWSRQGSAMNTTYELISDEKKALISEAKSAIKEVVPLEEFISGISTSLVADSKKESEEVKVIKKSEAPEEAEIAAEKSAEDDLF